MHARLAVGAIVFLEIFAASARARSSPADPALGFQATGLEVVAAFDHAAGPVAPVGLELNRSTGLTDSSTIVASATETAGVSGNWFVSQAPETKLVPAAGKRESATTELFRLPGSAEMGGGIPAIQGLERPLARFAVPGTNEPPLTPVPEAQTYALSIGLIALVYALFRHRRTFDRRHQLALRPNRSSTGL